MTPSDTPPVGGDWVLVPREPTEEMLAAGISCPRMKEVGQVLIFANSHGVCIRDEEPWPLQQAWAAMIAAAPPPPVGDREAVARLVEPDAWKWLDRGKYLEAHRPIADESLAKADAILRLLGLSPSLSPGELGGTGRSVADSGGSRPAAVKSDNSEGH